MTGIEVLLPYLAVAGAAVGAVGTVVAAQNQSDAEDYNAKVQDQNALTARVEGNSQVELQRQRGRAQIGRQLAATAESGTGLSGTNVDLLQGSMMGLALDTANMEYSSELKAHGMLAQAALDRSQESGARIGGYLSAAGQLLSASRSYTAGRKTVPGYPGVYQGGGMGADAGAGLNN